jgi:phosphoribosylglycinamide formyltransferase 1
VSLTRLGVLLSGRGSNFVALQRSCASGGVPAQIAVVASDNPEARGLDAAGELGIPGQAIDRREYRDRQQHELAVARVLEEHEIEWLCLAGYMRLLSPAFVARYRQRILNIHPSLLPAFPGLDAQRQALQHGVRISGCTVHFVDEGLDSGPIVEQRAVPVLDGDTEASLSARILEQEHLAYPSALRRLLTEPWSLEGRRVTFGAR